MLGECWPKNVTDHRTLRMSCVAKIKIIFALRQEPEKNLFEREFHIFFLSGLILFFGSHFFDQTKYRAMPIKINKVVHTGPKIQFGGLKLGLFKVLYQEPIAGVVKIAPMVPANSQIIMLVKSFIRLLYFM